jgi:phospholipid/cholesterol/gamma-HCH transport system substrate-binding protein
MAAAASHLKPEPSYDLQVRLASAANLVAGGTVQVNGFKAGRITSLSVDHGQALVKIRLDRKFAPLHDGATAIVDWKAVLGERIVNISDGERTNSPVPDGGMLTGAQPAPVELDQVLNALNPTTRAHLVRVVKSMDETLSGKVNERNLAATVQSAGPALRALGDVLRALGTDGPAIKNLVTRLNTMVTTLSSRDSDVRAMVDQLAHLTRLTAGQRASLSAALAALPGTLKTADTVLGHVPQTVDKANVLLKDLRGATSQLPATARDLRPVLDQLRPVSARLRTTLTAAAQLLQYTPGLLNAANTAVPGLDTTLTYLQPVLSFLRPYTPEAVGFLSAWASAMGNYDANGHYARIWIQAGGASLNVNPGIPVPGISNDPYPLPGALVHQPWTDAFGSGAR